MKIIFDNYHKMYGIQIEDQEAMTWINTDDIAEARTEFLNRMKWLFNLSVCEHFHEE